MNYTGPDTAGPPPPGDIPDISNREDAGALANIIGMTVMVTVVTVFVGFRVYVKWWITRKRLLEDWILFFGWVGRSLQDSSPFLVANRLTLLLDSSHSCCMQ